MSEIHGDLPIKVLSRDEVEIDWKVVAREAVEKYCHLYKELNVPVECLAWRYILRLMDKYQEPKPTWEPGTVLNGYLSRPLRLDKYLGGDRWAYTDLKSGSSSIAAFFPEDNYTIHRLPHEFKVGDWADIEGYVFKVAEVSKNSLMDEKGCHWNPSYCRHCPPPKQEPVTAPKPLTGPHWFSEENRRRCESDKGFSHKLGEWNTSDWFLAVLGELGEAANQAKKLNRVRDGIPGNKETEEELRSNLRKELGDVFVYLDLLCQSLGFYVMDAAVEVFDAKSQQIGYPENLRSRLLALERKVGK